MNQRFSYSVSQLKSVNQQISELTNQWFNNSEIGLLTAHGPKGTRAHGHTSNPQAHGHTGNPRAHGHTGTRAIHGHTGTRAHGDTRRHSQITGTRAQGQSTGTRAHGHTSNPRAIHGHTGTLAPGHGPTVNHPRAQTTRQPHGPATRNYNDGQGAHNAAMTSRCGNRLTHRQTDGRTDKQIDR